MVETTKKSKNAIIGIVFTIIVIASVSVCIWYFQVKKPHDEAVNGFNTATETLEVKNAELDSVIADAQSLMDETNKPFSTISLPKTSSWFINELEKYMQAVYPPALFRLPLGSWSSVTACTPEIPSTSAIL